MFVLVTVEPEGVVAIRGVQERKFIIFNIVCDELYLGIPEKAWYVVMLVILCLVVAFVIPPFLPLYLLPTSQNRNIADQVGWRRGVASVSGDGGWSRPVEVEISDLAVMVRWMEARWSDWRSLVWRAVGNEVCILFRSSPVWRAVGNGSRRWSL
nr:uncharacterized protein LOC109179876 isoform X2 [Ipomoea batatas]